MKSPRMPATIVLNRQRKLRVDRARLEAFAQRALVLCGGERGTGLTSLEEIAVVLVSDRRMSQLHRRFMGIPGPTDVITFQHGEIFLSVETARRQSRIHRTSLVGELQLYLVHGLLHLHGFDDREPAGRRRMQALQERILARVQGGIS